MPDTRSAEAWRIFSAAIAQAADADQIARLELVREFVTNPEFRAAMTQHVWETLEALQHPAPAPEAPRPRG